MKKISKMALDCAINSNQTKVKKEEEPDQGILSNYNEYFFQNAYDAYAVDKAVSGNLLYFNLIYCYNKFDWKNKISSLNEAKFKNFSYKMQLSYRNNFYHSQVHAADVVQNLS